MNHEPVQPHPTPSPEVTPQSLSANAGLYCALLESAPNAVVLVADDGTIVLVNAQTEQLFGYTRRELVGHPVEVLIPRSAHLNHLGHRAGYVAKPSARPMGSGSDLQAVRKDGTVFPVEISLSPVETSAGRLVSATIRDITVRKAMEDTIRASHAQLEVRVRERTSDLLAAQASAHLGSWKWDIRTGTVQWSDEQFRIFGYAPHSIAPTSHTFVTALHPEDQERVLAAINATLSLNRLYNCECRIRRQNGDIRELLCRGEVTRDETGRPSYMVGTVLDITERKRFEQTRAYLAAIVAASDDAIVGESLDGIIVSWNPAAERISGYSAHDVIGRPLIDLLPQESYELERTILARIGRGESIAPHEYGRVRKDGTLIHVSVTVFPIKDSMGRIIGLSRFVRDITAQKRAEEQLRETERLAELGTLASGLAHEIGTPMNVIQGRAEYMMERSSDEPTKKGLQTIVTQVERITKLMTQLMAFARRSPPKRQALNLRHTIHETLEFFRERFTQHRTVMELACDEDCPPVLADPNQMSQVLINLIVNAIHAMPDGGTLRLGLTATNGRAELTVADTGKGIAKEHMTRIFEAFFTTKEKGKGTGLGLSVVKGVIDEHGGSIAVESEPGRGTTFTIHLPLFTTSESQDIPLNCSA